MSAHQQRISVVHIITRPERGGAQGNTLYTVQHLDRLQFVPALITSPAGPLAAEMAAISDADVTFLPEMVSEINPWRDWRAVRRLTEMLAVRQPHIVHTHSSKAGILGRLAARCAGVPIVVHTVHGFPFHAHQSRSRRRFYITLERAAAHLTRRFICVSQADIRKAEQHGIFSQDRATLIRSGISLAAFHTARGRGRAMRRILEIPPGAPLVGMVACLKPQKDPLTFVRVAAAVRALVPEAWFLMAGDGRLRSEVEALSDSLGMTDRLRLCGWSDDIPAVMDALDLLVLTSLHEGLPRVVPEAMAAGKPVVATQVDGIPEAVTDGVTGYLFPPGSVDRAVPRVVELLSDPGRARCMGEEGRRRVGIFDIRDMVRRQENLYRELLATVPAGEG